MAADWFLKVGDTKAPLECILSDALGAVDLTDATEIRFQMRKRRSTTETKVDGEATPNPDQTNHRGWVKYEWEDTDVDTPGTFYGEFKVTWSDGKTTTFPNGERYLVVEIGAGVDDKPAP